MTKSTENQNTEPNRSEKPEEAVDTSQYKKRFEEAVADAQHMMMYASSNCPQDIEPQILEKLINARRRVENKQELSAEEETEFLIAYQELWKLVQPATAESIKANLRIASTFKGPISEARRTVNGYIVFTVFVLILLLIFQIYWVVGNQLITELGTVSKSEDLLNAQLHQNEQESNAIKMRFRQLVSSPDFERETLENESTKIGLTADLESLKSKQDRYSAILRFWSKPWSGFIIVKRVKYDKETNDPQIKEFDLQINEIQNKINEIQNKINSDPDGTKEATVKAQQTDLKEQLDNSQSEQDKGRIQEQIDRVSEKSALDSQLIDLETTKEEIQGQIDSLSAEKEESQNKLNDLVANLNVVQGQIDSSTAEKDYYQQPIPKLNEIKQSIEAILASRTTTEQTPPAPLTPQEIESLPDVIKADSEFNKTVGGENQLNYLSSYQQDIEQQLLYLDESTQSIQAQIDNYGSQKNDIQRQIDDLNAHIGVLTKIINTLPTDQDKINDQIKTATKRIETLNNEIAKFSVTVSSNVSEQIVKDREADLQKLKGDRGALEEEEQVYLELTDSRPAQLAGQFVLNILQSYILPILYGLLGAGTYVLRSLSRKIKDVTYSEVTGIQHLLSISLGALAGIMVGWFSFLIDTGTTTFLGSVSPLAIAFLVGYNIEPFFSRIDAAMKMNETPRQTAPATAIEARPAASQTARKSSSKKRKASKSSSKQTKATKGKSGSKS